MRYERYEKEAFSKAVCLNNSLSDVAREIGLSPSKGNRDTIKRYIRLYNLDTSHFKSPNVDSSANFKKRELSDILVENSTYSSTRHLKDRLYKDGLKDRKCEMCGQGEEWMGKRISLIIDHINGVNHDNRLENLRIVCPNCNATLDTNCSKNKTRYNTNINTNKCVDCDIEISKNSKRCGKCDQIKKRKIERPTYEQLLEDIEELGYVGTGKKYGVSDNSIRKWKRNI